MFSKSCGLEVDGKFVVTGGSQSKSKVAEFTEAGTVKYLPRLKTGRFGHACSTFNNDKGDTVRVYKHLYARKKQYNAGFPCYWRKDF